MLYKLRGIKPSLAKEGNFIAPSASVIGNVTLGPGASIWFNTVLRADNELMVIGKGSNIQDGSVCHSDPGAPLTLGEGVTVGHNVTIHGCTIRDNVLVGMGSTILNHAVIGKNTIIGAGTLVTEGKEIPAGVLVVGTPARVVRELSEDEIENIRESGKGYLNNAARFQSELEAC